MRILYIFAILLLSWQLGAQNENDKKQSVLLSAEVQESPAQITLHWVQDLLNSGFTIYRKTKAATTWGSPLGTKLSTDTTWVDNNVVPGQTYEYRVLKNLTGYGGGNSAGYIYAGIKANPTHFWGSCILVVDSTFKSSLDFEINRLQQDIKEDGWRLHTIFVDRNDPVTVVKNAIKAIVNIDGNPFKTVFLLGHVPVPYSGFIAPDGHTPDHQGAWPCDGYYADMDGTWTDNSINTTVPADPRNHNTPGDGKFDQSSFPSALELGVGRVDFANMPAFALSEVELLRRYLNKNHAWRKGLMPVQERGLVQNNFAGFPEGFGQNGWKNFIPMFGADNVKELPYRSTLQSNNYLWSYGCGPGSYTSASGIVTTSELAVDSLQTVFTMLFGSYFGDWDRSNNLLRAALASGSTLTNAWAARPNWMFHHMALGEPIGFSTRLSMTNNGALYQSGNSPMSVHIGLMGDPTIGMHVNGQPQNLTASAVNFNVELTWDAVDNVIGYYVYKLPKNSSRYQLMVPNPVTSTSFTDTCSGEGLQSYQVRAVSLRESASGSYYHVGPAASFEVMTDHSAIAAVSGFVAVPFFDELSLANASSNASSYLWKFGDGSTSTEAGPTHFYPNPGNYNVCLIASDACYSDTLCQDVTILNSLPNVASGITPVKCSGENTGGVQLILTGGAPSPDIIWSNGSTSTTISNLIAGSYSCTITSSTQKTEIYGPFVVTQPDPIMVQITSGPSDPGQNNGFVDVFIEGGTSPFTILWSNGSDNPTLTDLAPGQYCYTITDANDCTYDDCLMIEEVSGINSLPGLISWKLSPNPTRNDVQLQMQFDQGHRLQIAIIDMTGRVRRELIAEGNTINQTIDMSSLPSGQYILRIQSEDGQMTMPLSKVE